MKKLCYFISFLFLLLTFAGCENDGTLNENSEIVVVGLGHKVYNLPLGNEILFTGNDIKWFNRDTREIRFYDHSVFKEKLEQYEKILVILADTELFTATNVSDVMASVSTVYNDLVLYYDTAEDKYYLKFIYLFFFFFIKPVTKCSRRAFVDLCDQFIGGCIFYFHPGSFLGVIYLWQCFYTNTRMLTKVRLPYNCQFAV